MLSTMTPAKVKNQMRILHLASFSGNIGDNVSYMGFHNLLKTLDLSPQITQLEMRKFYDNYKESDKRYFNQDLIDEINSYDLCICGGDF